MSASHGLAMYDETKAVVPAVKVEDYAYLVKRIAHHMMMRMPASVQVEDLVQAGMIGLLEAVNKYDMSKGASFETYAGIRIRGAIVDEMRRGDWAPRSVHRNARRLQGAINAVENREGRDASDQEIAQEMGVSVNEYHEMLQDTASCRLFSFEEAAGDDGGGLESSIAGAFDSPLAGVEQNALKKALAEAISQLPEREKLVLALYYDEELNLKEIGQIIGVSESRVSQIHGQAAQRLRARLADWKTNN